MITKNQPIEDYKVVFGSTISDLEDGVKKCLANGWHVGDFRVEKNSQTNMNFYQVMIKYAPGPHDYRNPKETNQRI